MTFSAGTKCGVYEILSPLGAGGIGDVYRARDSKLDRDVAIKEWARASRGPISLKIDQIRGSPLENRLYCLLYTFVLFTASPLAFVPV
jgi:serine/threonine protein kinase